MDEKFYVIPLKLRFLRWLAIKFGAVEPAKFEVLPPAQWETGFVGKYLLYLSFHTQTIPKLKLTVVTKPREGESK